MQKFSSVGGRFNIALIALRVMSSEPNWAERRAGRRILNCVFILYATSSAGRPADPTHIRSRMHRKTRVDLSPRMWTHVSIRVAVTYRLPSSRGANTPWAYVELGGWSPQFSANARAYVTLVGAWFHFGHVQPPRLQATSPTRARQLEPTMYHVRGLIMPRNAQFSKSQSTFNAWLNETWGGHSEPRIRSAM